MLSSSFLSNKTNSYEAEDGFTLVEILVVILIIGILAAIAIPTFLNQRKKANDATVQSDIRHAIPVTETFFANNPDVTKVNLTEIQKMMAKNSSVRLTWTGNHNDYCIEGQHTNGDLYKSNWIYSSVSGKTIPGNQSGFSCSGYGTKTFETHVVWNATT